MTDRTPLNTRVDEDVKKRFRDFTHEKKGKIRGEMGRLVERALIEYMDRDRQARLEEDHERLENKVDTILATLSDGQTTHTQGSCTTDDCNREGRNDSRKDTRHG